MGEEGFSAHLLDGLAADVVRTMRQAEVQQNVQPRASLHTRLGSRNIDLSDITDPLEGDIQAILLVEDVNLTWIEAIGKNLGIEAAFFVDHVQEIGSRNDWATIMCATQTQTVQEVREQLYSSVQATDQAHCWHLDGIAISEATCLILVDAPASETPLDLHLPVSRNRSGLVIPRLYNQRHSLYECINRFLSHGWHFNIMFSDHSLNARTFAYTLAASTWRTNLRELDTVAKHIGFEEIRKPTVAINNKLHDLRRDLDRLRKEVSKTLEWIPEIVKQELDHIRKSSSEYIILLDSNLEQILVESSTLEKFLMDSFTLLLSSINVQEAEASAKMSQRAQQLTTLAFIYVPLSFVTGVFGMNVREINGSIVPAWVPVATLAVTLSLTALTFTVFYLLQHKKKA